MIEKYLDTNNLIIVPNTIKKRIIKELNSLDKLISYKVMDIKEFLENYFLSYDKKTVLYLVTKYNYSPENAIELLNNLYYLEDKKYNSKKLNDLLEIKKELDNNNLLKYNSNFKYYLSKVKILVYGYKLDPFYLNILPEPIEDTYTKKELEVLEFSNIDDEISYIGSDILDKINSGVDINKIKIINSGSEYLLPLKRIFNWLNIPIDINKRISIYDTSIGKKVIKLLESGKTFNEIIELLSNIDSDILNKIINVFNSYIDLDINIDMIKYDLKNIYLKEKHLTNSIKLIDLAEVEEDDYVYLVGFNRENYPIIEKDDGYFSDTMKEELGLFNSNQINEIEKEKLKYYLYSIPNLIITYKLKNAFSDFNPSVIISEDSFKIKKDLKLTYNKSDFFNKIKLSTLYDNYNKYGIIDNDLKLLRAYYGDNLYETYSNKYTGVSNIDYLANKDTFTVSYSQLNEYYTCSFSYYLKRVLKLEDLSVNEFPMRLGSLFHYVLEHYKDSDFDFDRLWNEGLREYSFSISELLILNKLKEELRFDIDIIRKQEEYSNFTNAICEKEFNIPINNTKGIKTVLNGKIDKILYEEYNGTVNAALIDYKTGNNSSNIDNINYGLDMQLPIYMYILKKSGMFSSVNIAGFYLQHLINREEKLKLNKTPFEVKKDALKLNGYSNNDISVISRFDKTYDHSLLITGMSLTKEGNISNKTKNLSCEELNKLTDIIEEKIEHATNMILDSKYDINPKKIDDFESCKYCPYRDICFKTQSDIKEFSKVKLSTLLGGEE